jgi:hypothetical protein
MEAALPRPLRQPAEEPDLLGVVAAMARRRAVRDRETVAPLPDAQGVATDPGELETAAIV